MVVPQWFPLLIFEACAANLNLAQYYQTKHSSKCNLIARQDGINWKAILFPCCEHVSDSFTQSHLLDVSLYIALPNWGKLQRKNLFVMICTLIKANCLVFDFCEILLENWRTSWFITWPHSFLIIWNGITWNWLFWEPSRFTLISEFNDFDLW